MQIEMTRIVALCFFLLASSAGAAPTVSNQALKDKINELKAMGYQISFPPKAAMTQSLPGISRSDKMSAKTSSAMPFTRMKKIMIEWYCKQSGNAAKVPCRIQTFLRNMKTMPEEAVISQAETFAMADMQIAKRDFADMFRAFCASSPPSTSRTSICTNPLLMSRYK